MPSELPALAALLTMHEPADLDNQIIIAIRRISQAVENYSRYLWQEFGLTSPQLGMLRELEARGSGTPTQIAEWMSISPATTAGILKRLEERQLIDRCRDPEDKRSFVVKVSSQGIALAARAPSLLRDQFRQELHRLESGERMQILAVLRRVAGMMHAEDSEETPFLYTDPPPVTAQSPGSDSGSTPQ